MSGETGECTLAHLPPKGEGLIARLDGERAVVRRLMELGLVPGTRVRVVRSAPFGDPIELVVRGVHLSLRRADARMVHVERG